MNNVVEKKKRKEFFKYIKEKNDMGCHDDALMPLLHKAQELYGYINQDAMDDIAIQLGIPSSQIWGVVTFYHHFNLKPRGKYVISVCLGTACYIRGAKRVLSKIKEELGIGLNETTENGMFTLETKYCLGCCGMSPVMMINGKVYDRLTTKKVSEVIRELKDREKSIFLLKK